ncbi:hypothetical protein ACFOWB_00415 [Chenggangzhangella methanolivorans]
MSQTIELEHGGAACTVFLDGPKWGETATATIGRFRCPSAEAGRALIEQAVAKISEAGVTAVLGPMDGDTWHAYRLVAESDGSPPFLMEPASGPHDREAFTAAGFAPVSAYVSTRGTLDEAIGDGLPAALEGVAVTQWDGSNPDGFVRRLYAMSAGAFERNAFFKPLDLEGFLELYAPIIPAVDPRFVLFAHDQRGDLVGFLFAIPNRLEGPMAKTIIVKTYASMRRGVGRVLLDHVHRLAREAGFSDFIHALMHVDNVSLDRSQKHAGKVFRRYELMARRLD